MIPFLFFLISFFYMNTSFAGWITPDSYRQMVPTYFLSYMLKIEHRIPSYPFITGDTFRNYCDFVLDETNLPFNPDEVQTGDTIFLTASPFILTEFFKFYHPKIKNNYIIVTHNHDYWMPAQFAAYLDDPKIIAWFSKNIDRSHPKLKAIPIGIPNPIWTNDGYCNPSLFNNITKNLVPLNQRNPLIYLNIGLHTNVAERTMVLNSFKNKPFCFNASKKSSAAYLDEMKQFTFVMSPPGNGFDCFRTWEALLLGCIPIVKHSTIDTIFEDLPVILINDWSEITPAFLDQKLKEFTSRNINKDKLYIDYWLAQIETVKKNSKL